MEEHTLQPSDLLAAAQEGLHRMTYYRLLAKAMKAQERSIALESDWLRTRGFLSEKTVF